jgi:hypothetical protein
MALFVVKDKPLRAVPLDQVYSQGYWIVIALLLYEMNTFTITVFTVFHLTVNLPSELHQKPLSKN